MIRRMAEMLDRGDRKRDVEVFIFEGHVAEFQRDTGMFKPLSQFVGFDNEGLRQIENCDAGLKPLCKVNGKEAWA